MTGNDPNARTTEEIDENLRRVFREMQGDDLPDRFTNLLEQLRARDGKVRAGSEESS
jgi:hypothetical protein